MDLTQEYKLLDAAIKEQLPEFHRMCNTEHDEPIQKVILTQDAFALEEITLLGAAVKYAGYKNKELIIIPSNHLN